MLRIIVSPFYLLVPPLLLLLSLPLAVFAAFTTTLAIITLLFRVSLVYFDLGLALLHDWLFNAVPAKATQQQQQQQHHHHHHYYHSSSTRKSPYSVSPTTSSGHSTNTPAAGRHHQRSSKSSPSPSSLRSFGAEAADPHATQRPSRSDSYASLIGDGAPDRDYEGIGGWRDYTYSAAAADEEARWTNMNSRLELPAAAGIRAGGSESPVKPRRHKRSLTGSSQWLRMSPVQSRARSPSGSKEELGYFGQAHGSGRKVSPGGTAVGKQKATSVASMDVDYQAK